VQLTTVEFKAQHVELLRAALDSLKLRYSERNNQISVIGTYLTIDLANQKVVTTASNRETSLINRIKQAYSTKVVEVAAAKQKWIIKKLADNKMALRRF